jgi:hypothetical protein
MNSYVFIKDYGVHTVKADTPEKAIETVIRLFGNRIIIAWDSATGIDIK